MVQSASHSQSVLVNSSTQGSNHPPAVLDTETSASHEGMGGQKERAYLEKIKLLKTENKKLITLLRDSEKLFYQKLKETKKESENLSALFK
jgi:hypothetical protein